MKNVSHILRLLVLLGVVFILTACSQTSTTTQPKTEQPTQQPTQQPTAPSNPVNLSVDAGPDQELVVGQVVILDGSQSSGNANYTWKLLQKPATSTITLDKNNGVTVSFRPDVVGTYLGELTLTTDTTSKSDQVSIEVKEFVRTGIIASGAPVTSADGVTLSSPQDVPSTDVFIETLTKLNTPLPSIYKAVGQAYTLRSKTAIFSASGKHFELSLPVPNDSPKNELALAVLVPEKYQHVHLKKGGVFTNRWFIIDVELANNQTKALAALFMLVPDDLQLTLVSHQSFSSTPQNSLITLETSSRNFEARCSGEFQDTTTNCDSTDETASLFVFENIRNELDQKGFTDEPHIRRSGFIGNFVVDLVPSSTVPWSGRYTPLTASVEVASDGNFSNEVGGEASVARHEYFHAIQAATDFFALSFGDGWSVEAQATSIEQSQNDMQRDSSRNPRDIETSLLLADNSLAQYRAQDFWVFITKSINDSSSSLLRFLTRGHSVDSVDETFRNTNSVFPTFGDAYWAWAKNQAFEASVDIGIGASQCAINTQTVQNQSFQTFRPVVNSQGTATNLLALRRPVLEPFSSEVITINLAHDADPNYVSYRAIISANAGNEFNDLFEFKVYDDPSNALQPCTDISDGRRNIEVPRLRADGSQNSIHQIHVLISNTSDRRLAIDLFVDSLVEQLSSDAAALRLVRPTVTRIREGTRVGYEVEAVSPNIDSRLEWFINDELVKEDEVPRGRDNYSLSFVPCPQETTMRAVLLEDLAGNQVVNHTMEVVPFGEPIVETNLDGRYVGISTEAEIIRARITAATCNDPDSRGVNLQDVQWTINGNDSLIDEVLKFTKEEFVGINPATIGFSYPAKDPNAVQSQMIVYPCEVLSDLTTKSDALPCLSYQNQKGTEDMFRELELQATLEQAIGILQTRLNTALKDRGLDSKVIGMSRSDSLNVISSKFSKKSAGILGELFTVLESGDIATFDSKFKLLHIILAKEQVSTDESKLILEAMSLVMTQVDEYASRSDGGNNRWSQLLFVQDPDALVDRVNELAPATKALETYLSIVATTGEVSAVDEIVNIAAAGVALQSTRVSIGTTF